MMINLIKDIPFRRIESTYVERELDKGKEILEKQGYQIPSLAQAARLRMQEGRDAKISMHEIILVKDAMLYIPKKGKFLTKESPIMDDAAQAVKRQIGVNEYYLTEEQTERALVNAIRLPKREFSIRPDKYFSIPTDRFEEDEITCFAFGKSSEDYGDFLRTSGIKSMPVYMDKDYGEDDMCEYIGDKPFARQIRFYGSFNNNSAIGGNYDNVQFLGSIRGIRGDDLDSEPFSTTPEGKLKPVYSIEDLKILRDVREGNVAPKELERIISRFY